MARPRPLARSLAVGVGLITALPLAGAGCAQPTRHYLPGVVDDALSGALLYQHLTPPGPYVLGAGPGDDGRGCRTTSDGASGPPGSPGTHFVCLEDFAARATSDHVAAHFDVAADGRGCWRARVTALGFVVADGHGPRPALARFPVEVDGCGLPAVEDG